MYLKLLNYIKLCAYVYAVITHLCAILILLVDKLKWETFCFMKAIKIIVIIACVTKYTHVIYLPKSSFDNKLSYIHHCRLWMRYSQKELAKNSVSESFRLVQLTSCNIMISFFKSMLSPFEIKLRFNIVQCCFLQYYCSNNNNIWISNISNRWRNTAWCLLKQKMVTIYV